MAEVWPKTSEGRQVEGVASGHPGGPPALLSSGRGDYLQAKKTQKKNKKKTGNTVLYIIILNHVSHQLQCKVTED